jgi:hypothetical protein
MHFPWQVLGAASPYQLFIIFVFSIVDLRLRMDFAFPSFPDIFLSMEIVDHHDALPDSPGCIFVIRKAR